MSYCLTFYPSLVARGIQRGMEQEYEGERSRGGSSRAIYREEEGGRDCSLLLSLPR